jgi:hypothetical protein
MHQGNLRPAVKFLVRLGELGVLVVKDFGLALLPRSSMIADEKDVA